MADRRSVRQLANIKMGREIAMQRVLNRHFKALGRDLERRYNQNPETAVEGAVRDAQQDMRELLVNQNGETARLVGIWQYRLLVPEKMDTTLKVKLIEDDLESGIRLWIQEEALRSSLLTEATDRKVASAIISTGIEEGLTTPQIARDLRLVFSGLNIAPRSAMIARTEVGIAASESQDRAARSTGLNYQKEWIAVSDERTRDNHRLVDGQRVPKDGKFTVGQDQMLHPRDIVNGSAGNVINCRCDLAYIPEDTPNS